jgi:hypothetical protein
MPKPRGAISRPSHKAFSVVVLDRIIGHAGGSDLLPGRFRLVEDAGSHGGGILDQFLCVFAADEVDGMRNDRTQPGNDLFL